MRRLLLAVAMLAVMQTAQGADMPDLPILRGAFTEGPTPTVIWQGYYIGGQGGYGSSDDIFIGSTRTLAAALLANTTIENQMGVSQWNPGFGKISARSSAFGGFAGYNAQWEDVVLGLEMSYMHGLGGTSTSSEERVSGAALSDTFFHDVKATSSASFAISDMATFRGRAAYAYGCFLPYLFGGFAIGNVDITRSVTVQDAVSTTALGPFVRLAPLSASEVVHNHLIYGYSAGLGVDVNLIGGLFMRAEWEYVRFTTSIDTSVNSVRAGLGYKF